MININKKFTRVVIIITIANNLFFKLCCEFLRIHNQLISHYQKKGLINEKLIEHFSRYTLKSKIFLKNMIVKVFKF